LRLCFLLLLVSGASGAEDAGVATAKLSVAVQGFRNQKGQLLAAVYDSEANWLKVEKAVRVVRLPIPGRDATVSFEGLTPGIYAVSVFHDENANGKFDMHWFPVPGPDEGAAQSNDAKAHLGPPAFDDAKFRLGAGETAIQVHLVY